MQDGEAQITARAYWLPKAGHTEAEYEDAFAFSETDALPCHAAVADGATESAFARHWAEALARGFVDEEPDSPEALAEAAVRWQKVHAAFVAGRERKLPWYAAAKAEEGAFATLLGFALRPGGAWHALAVGDACLFHLRGTQERLRWPLDDPDAFGHRPALLGSRLAEEGTPAFPPVQEQTGTYRPGDTFLLATDAVAAWLMHDGPARALAFDGDAAFREAVRAARAAGAFRNDDATLVVLRVAADGRE